MKDDMSANNEAARARAAAYAGWFLYGADVQALLPRIDAAITRIVNGQGCMRIPADKEDPDLVLADCKKLLKLIASDTDASSAPALEERATDGVALGEKENP
jgi:hypothetical protein